MKIGLSFLLAMMIIAAMTACSGRPAAGQDSPSTKPTDTQASTLTDTQASRLTDTQAETADNSGIDAETDMSTTPTSSSDNSAEDDAYSAVDDLKDIMDGLEEVTEKDMVIPTP